METTAPPPAHFEELFPEVAPALFAWASLRVRAPLRARLDPEDVLQEIGFRAWRQFGDFNPSVAPFRAWVFGIAHRVLQEALRSVARSVVRGVDGQSSFSIGNYPASATSISRRVARDEAVQGFLRRLERLTEDDRRLVMLRGLEGLSHAEVADALSLTPDNAAKRWQRLRDTLANDPLAKVMLL